ncbi:hypothetical protein [Longimicrobium sp.]|uniref:hypothetical protein n=1 Tax=Longimicrobium sp. TaxID=2029185 RepID=UPI002C8079DB|nr:hypothetical protein [Longimicrobium sp.]HSU16244.1 hypothetical protein [Longimicrobium sp.]
MAKAITLVDNFGDNVTDATKWSAFGPVQEVNQRLEIRPVSGASNSFGGYNSVSAFDLTDSQVSVEVVRALRGVKGCEMYLHVQNAAGDHLFFKVEAGTLSCSTQPASATADTGLAQLPYDPTRHRWMRIREQFGIVYFEYSARLLRAHEVRRHHHPHLRRQGGSGAVKDRAANDGGRRKESVGPSRGPLCSVGPAGAFRREPPT